MYYCRLLLDVDVVQIFHLTFVVSIEMKNFDQ